MPSKKLQPKAQKLENLLLDKSAIKERKWKMKTYKNCFIGSDAVSAIIELKFANNQYQAIMFGNKLITADLIAHIENDHIFKNENLYYRFTKKYKKAKKKNNKNDKTTIKNNNNDDEKEIVAFILSKQADTMLTTNTEIEPPKPKKKVSFAIGSLDGFTFTASKSKSNYLSTDEDDNHWNHFGSISKSEFSFMSDRSSFAASLNTLSDANLWIVDHNKEKEHQIDFTKEENKNIQGFTFRENEKNTKLTPKTAKHPTLPRIKEMSVSRSVTSPSISDSRHSKTASGHSITFSSTVSLYSNTDEKKQNSMLFFDLWGVPLNRRSASDSLSSTNNAESGPSSYGSVSSPDGLTHSASSSASSSIFDGGNISRRPSTLVYSGPIDEEEEEWSEFSSHHDSDNEDNDDDVLNIQNKQNDDNDDDEEDEIIEMSSTATSIRSSMLPNPVHAMSDSISHFTADSMNSPRMSKKNSGGFKYRKRKSKVTTDFIFGKKKK